MPIKYVGVTAGRDRLEAEAERQQEGHKHRCSDMQTSMSSDVNIGDAATAMQTSKDGKPSTTQPSIICVLREFVPPCVSIAHTVNIMSL